MWVSVEKQFQNGLRRGTGTICSNGDSQPFWQLESTPARLQRHPLP